MKTSIFLIVAAILGVLLFNSAYTVTEGQQVLITQFGRIVGKPVTKAGLHWKTPFIQEARFFDKRILEWDGDPNQIPTLDKKFIWVDTTARWRIKDLVKFAETLRTERGAQGRLDSILDGATRDIISKHNLVEAVRNSNTILNRTKEIAKKSKEAKKDPEKSKEVMIEEEVTGDVERIAVGREQLSEMILDRAREKLSALGVELIDLQLRRIAYEKSVEEKVYERMVSERKRIAERIRSVGKGEQAKIRGKMNRDLKGIESAAYRKSQEIKGKAEASAISIYARSLSANPSFYEFVRTLEAYEKTLAQRGSFILSTDSEFLKLLKQK